MNKNIVKDFLYERESYNIRGAIFEVWKNFRGIFKERVIESALQKELEDRGLRVESQKRIDIYYKGKKIGIYTPDLIIDDSVLIEIKVKPYLIKEDERQFWYYLRGSQYKLGFLVNFGTKKLEIKHRVYDKAREKYKKISVDQRTHQRVSASKNSGFTLIEIIITIAVIGILVGIVFVASGPARKQAKDARIKSNLVQLQNRAENIYLDEGSYNSVSCGGDTEINSLCQDISAQAGSPPNIYKSTSPANKYCAYSCLKSVEDTAFCIDYKGNAVETPHPEYTCPTGNNYNCPCVHCFDFDGDGDVDFDDAAYVANNGIDVDCDGTYSLFGDTLLVQGFSGTYCEDTVCP